MVLLDCSKIFVSENIKLLSGRILEVIFIQRCFLCLMGY